MWNLRQYVCLGGWLTLNVLLFCSKGTLRCWSISKSGLYFSIISFSYRSWPFWMRFSFHSKCVPNGNSFLYVMKKGDWISWSGSQLQTLVHHFILKPLPSLLSDSGAQNNFIRLRIASEWRFNENNIECWYVFWEQLRLTEKFWRLNSMNLFRSAANPQIFFTWWPKRLPNAWYYLAH